MRFRGSSATPVSMEASFFSNEVQESWSTEVRDPRLFCLIPERIGRISRPYQKLWQMFSMTPMEKKLPIRFRRPFVTARPTSTRKQQRIVPISAICLENNAHLVHQEHAVRAPISWVSAAEHWFEEKMPTLHSDSSAQGWSARNTGPQRYFEARSLSRCEAMALVFFAGLSG